MVRRAGVGTVVASADSIAVESGGAVSHGARPLADDRPFVRAGVDVCVVADVLAVLPRLHGDKIVAEARVLVVVDYDPLRVVIGGGEEVVVGVDVLEAVVEHEDAGLRDYALVPVSIAVELAGDVGVESGIERFVERFDRGDDVVVLGIGVLFLDLAQDGKCAVYGAALLPAGLCDFLA